MSGVAAGFLSKRSETALDDPQVLIPGLVEPPVLYILVFSDQLAESGVLKQTRPMCRTGGSPGPGLGT